MRFRIFKANDGDCCLITGTDNTRILIDGGRTGSYEQHVAPALTELHAAGNRLDLVCVSHIDNDHISGILRMLDDKVAWRVHRFQRDHDNPNHPPPAAGEPPDIAEIWNNGFSDLVPDNQGAIEDQLATRAAFLSASQNDRHRIEAEWWENLAQGEDAALRLRRRIGDRQLGLPINEPADGRVLILVQNQPPVQIGDLSVQLIGPYAEDVETLRERWNEWLEDHQQRVEEIRAAARAEEEDLGLSGIQRLTHRLGSLATEIGDTSALKPPNVASIQFLVHEGNQSILMTGDGGWDVIEGGLENAGIIGQGQGLHVNILKVPHHGSKFNVSVPFTQRVTADNYVFCSNGAHHNPDREVVEAYINSRLGPNGMSANPEVGEPFRFWFTYGPDDPSLTATRRAHMQMIHDFVTVRAAASGGQMSVRFATESFEDIELL